MIWLGAVAVTVLAANGAARLRRAAGAFFLVSLAADAVGASTTALPLLAVAACAGTVSAAILYVAAGDETYGEEPGWRLWMATIVAGGAAAAAFASFRTVAAGMAAPPPPYGDDPAGVTVAAFCCSPPASRSSSPHAGGARHAGALLMTSGVQLLMRLRRTAPRAVAARRMAPGRRQLRRGLIVNERVTDR